MNDSMIYGIVGAGGFGREIMPVACAMLTQQGVAKEQIVFVDDGDVPDFINGHCVLSTREFFNSPAQCRYFNVAIGDGKVRKELAYKFLDEGASAFSIKCPSAMDKNNNKISRGAILSPYSIITANAQIGEFFHLNIYSYVAHDCVIGNFVTFAPKVQCNGGVVIEDGVYVGSGAIIRNSTPTRKITIGRGAVIGMGAVVTKSVPAGATVVGNPAFVLNGA